MNVKPVTWVIIRERVRLAFADMRRIIGGLNE